MGDFELLKEVPGYKAILKVVLKSQIQLLIDQLCKYTGEESFILTANASDGAQSLLGSGTGKGFLENRSEIKTQFLGYCLKSLHNPEEMDLQHRTTNTRTKFRPHPYTRVASSPQSIQSPVHHNERSGISGKFCSIDATHLNDSKLRDSSSSIVYNSNVSEADNYYTGETYRKKEPHKSPFFQTSGIDFEDRISDIYHPEPVQAPGDTDQNQAQEKDCLLVKTELEVDEVEVTGVELGNRMFGGDSSGQFSSDSNQTSASPDNFALMNSTTDTGAITDFATSESNVDDAVMPKHYYPCRYCGRVFQHNSWLTRHLRGHTGEKPYECRVCGKRFTRSGTMKVHTLMHNLK